jgi:hypothetical protein
MCFIEDMEQEFKQNYSCYLNSFIDKVIQEP